MTGFIFGGNTGLSYDQLQKQRKQLDAQRGQRFAPKNVGEGLSALGHALGTRITNKRLGEAETARQGRADNAFSAFQTLLGGGGHQPVNPMQPPSASSDKNAAFGGDLKSGIAATAQSLGVDPVDLATAISYETAGTFDPKKAGPTTQWGQHRGLIQFGEPQAKKYGVNWDDPIGSQLGENGAVANYLRDTGVKPGMGLLDIYSAINAGGVGRYNRSDANNGGAPGNVRDKVEQQMAGHRAKAQAMFGGDQVAQAQPQSGGIDPKLYELMSDPSLSPRRQSAMQMLLEQKLKANGPTDPMGRLQMERLQLQNKQLRNPAAPERKTVKDMNGRLRYLDDGAAAFPDVEKNQDPLEALKIKQAQAKLEQSQGPDFTGQQKLRKEYDGINTVKSFREQTQAYQRVLDSSKNASAAGDLALIFNYMKVLDPGSVVRESEFATAAASGSYGQRIQAAVNKAQSGERLSPIMRRDFVHRAGNLYQGASELHGLTNSRFGQLAQKRGYNPADIISDPASIGVMSENWDLDGFLAPPAADAPEVGMTDGNHRFKGGNPADPNNWEEVR